MNKQETCLFKDLYKDNKRKVEKKDNNDNKNENEDINQYNLFGSTQMEIQLYQNIKEFNEKYYLNGKNNKYLKDDYSYDVEKIVFDDDKEFYLPYNKTALFINQQRFVTPYDIHDTMVYFVSNDYYWKSKKGQSLTDEIDGLKRNCENYIDDFDNETIKEYCRCIPFQ